MEMWEHWKLLNVKFRAQFAVLNKFLRSFFDLLCRSVTSTWFCFSFRCMYECYRAVRVVDKQNFKESGGWKSCSRVREGCWLWPLPSTRLPRIPMAGAIPSHVAQWTWNAKYHFTGISIHSKNFGIAQLRITWHSWIAGWKPPHRWAH